MAGAAVAVHGRVSSWDWPLGNHFPIPQSVYEDASVNLGAYVLSQTSFQIFGTVGMAFLAVMVTLTCFTTTVGLIAAVSTFFAEEFPVLSYKKYVTLICLVSLVLANLGLNQIIQVTLPLLLFVYPIAISVVMLTIINGLSACRNWHVVLSPLPAWYRPSTLRLSSSISTGRLPSSRACP